MTLPQEVTAYFPVLDDGYKHLEKATSFVGWTPKTTLCGRPIPPDVMVQSLFGGRDWCVECEREEAMQAEINEPMPEPTEVNEPFIASMVRQVRLAFEDPDLFNDGFNEAKVKARITELYKAYHP